MSSPQFFRSSVSTTDPTIAQALQNERVRQNDQLEFIASENIVSQAVLDALGHQVTNKTLEGYPGKRFHGGAQFVDVMEQTAIDRARQLFSCEYANVQPHSGTQANQAVFFATLEPGDRILSLNLSAGGHLSHGAKPNLSGRWFESYHYGVNRRSGLIEYEEIDKLASEIQPKMIITGGSAYPRTIDFQRISGTAKKHGSLFLVDMAHIAGLVAAGVHPSPIPHADIVTCTTTKTMRGPRGGIIFTNDRTLIKKLQSSIFPGVQGSLHTQIIAAKAVCLGEALSPEFKVYGRNIVLNAQALANTLIADGVDLVSDGTDTHMVLLNLSENDMSGQELQDALDLINITSNKNPIPFDQTNPEQWQGLRLGVSAVTTRGLEQSDMEKVGHIISNIILNGHHRDPDKMKIYKDKVREICEQYPIYGN